MRTNMMNEDQHEKRINIDKMHHEKISYLIKIHMLIKGTIVL
jgi:hypothetical protein